MATITKRASGYFVQIRRKGFPPEYKTLRTRGDAERWARDREARIDRGELPPDRRALRGVTLGDLIRRYLIECTPNKRSAESEVLRLGKMLRAPIASLAVADLSTAAVAGYRDQRASEVQAGTIARELGLLGTVIEVARRDWGMALPKDVVRDVRRPPVRNARDRRLKAGELDRLRTVLGITRNPYIAPAVFLAIETALRRGELLGLTWSAIDWTERTAFIPHTKTGYSRTIPLTGKALEVLSRLPRDGDRIFPISAMALRLAWDRATARAGIPDLRFHDLRHEAISRFAELGLSLMELAVISGHREPRMLFRYTHIQPRDLATKLANN